MSLFPLGVEKIFCVVKNDNRLWQKVNILLRKIDARVTLEDLMRAFCPVEQP
jgi:hypothetical protein